jgi:hypothetical protein
MYRLVNTFIDETISRHRTLRAAAIARFKVGRNLTGGSYIPTDVCHDDGSPLTEDEYDELCDVDPYEVR